MSIIERIQSTLVKMKAMKARGSVYLDIIRKKKSFSLSVDNKIVYLNEKSQESIRRILQQEINEIDDEFAHYEEALDRVAKESEKTEESS